MVEDTDIVISADNLHSGHALSLTQQPLLKELLERVSDSTMHVTLIVGAGASVDSGFLNWQSFVERLAALAPTKEFEAMLLMDSADGPLRRADTALGMAQTASAGTTEEIVRRELYATVEEPTVAGETARAVAGVRARSGARGRIITTNFDDVLEEALKAENNSWQVSSFALGKRTKKKTKKKNGERRWKDFKESEDQCSVLHIHGMLPRHQDAKKPLVLSERQFLKHGPRVRRLISEMLENGTVIFIGVSLQDPNLILPLWDSAHSATASNAYVLSVPVLSVQAREGGLTLEDARTYEREKAVLIHRSLGVKPILLKSYSQLHQALRELAMATHQGGTRVADITGIDRYGARFDRILAYSHGAVQSRGAQAPELLRSNLRAGARLWKLLTDPDEEIKRRHEKLISDIGSPLSPTEDREERFAIFVWLRSMSEGYSLDLVASSVYQYLDDWARPTGVEIEPTSRYIAAESAFMGSSVSSNYPKTESVHQWRGMLAVPIRVGEKKLSGVEEESVAIGVVTLNTSFHILPEIAKKDGEKTYVSILSAYPNKREIEDELILATMALLS